MSATVSYGNNPGHPHTYTYPFLEAQDTNFITEKTTFKKKSTFLK